MLNRTLITAFSIIIAISVYAQPRPPHINAPAVIVDADSIVFAVIGDYGRDTKQEDSVAKMVKSWNPDFIITVGDNNYPLGSAKTIKDHIGKYYGDYIYNPDAPVAQQCHGKAEQEHKNRFFPCPGNHDHYSIPSLKPYLKYFTLPGDERNYDFMWGPVLFWSIDAGTSGNLSVNSAVANRVKDDLSRSKAPFKIVYFHQPPYSPGPHGSDKSMQWPFTQWGVDAVLCGHEHFYAHITDKTAAKPIYLITGNGGSDEHYDCNAHLLDPDRFSVKCDNVHFGAIKVRANSHQMIFEYYAVEQPSAPWDVVVVNK